MQILVVEDERKGAQALKKGLEREQHRICDRFYRISKDRTHIDGGTGLGRSLAQWAVKLHDGRVEMESLPGDGSRFIIILPVKNKL